MSSNPRRRARDTSPGLPISLPTPPGLPGPIVPEMSSPCLTPFDSPDWRYTVDWDGARTLLFVDRMGLVRLQSERGDDVSSRYPELIGTAAIFGGHAAVLDGVVAIVDAEGRPDLRALGDRLVGSTGAVRLPVVYLATDLLFIDGQSTMRWSLDRRHRTLQRAVADDLRIQVCDLVAGEGHAFAVAAATRNLPAILARRGRAAYHPGITSPDRLRVALEDRANAAVVAISPAPARPGEVLVTLAEISDGTWLFAGAMRLPRHEQVAIWLSQQCEQRLGTMPPGFPAPTAETVWVEPHVVATVRHRGRHPDGALRSVTLVALRDDVDVRWCVRRSVTAPPAGEGHEFRPTVMSGLPLPETRSR